VRIDQQPFGGTIDALTAVGYGADHTQVGAGIAMFGDSDSSDVV
jgi:hypothetical protein